MLSQTNFMRVINMSKGEQFILIPVASLGGRWCIVAQYIVYTSVGERSNVNFNTYLREQDNYLKECGLQTY